MRGKKTDYETIYDVMTSYFTTHNYEETARQLNMSASTVKDIVKNNKNAEEFVELRRQKQDEFSEKASRLIDKLLDRLDDELNAEDKDIPINHITTAIGTLYDKRALSKGEMTQNVGFATNLSIDKLAEISGFAKKDGAEE